jgi:hypothetical protein
MMVKVMTARNPTEAHWMVGVLASHGILAVVDNEFVWTTLGPVFESVSMGVKVHEADEEGARRVLREALAARERAPDPEAGILEWQCEGCDEMLEGTFTECWSCGGSRPHDPQDSHGSEDDGR